MCWHKLYVDDSTHNILRCQYDLFTQSRSGFDKEMSILNDALRLDGADEATSKNVLADARKVSGKFKKSTILDSYQPTRPVKLV